VAQQPHVGGDGVGAAAVPPQAADEGGEGLRGQGIRQAPGEGGEDAQVAAVPAQGLRGGHALRLQVAQEPLDGLVERRRRHRRSSMGAG
jgi:hypothetical protein